MGKLSIKASKVVLDSSRELLMLVKWLATRTNSLETVSHACGVFILVTETFQQFLQSIFHNL